MTIGKTIALTRWTFVDKVMSLLFNMLSRLVITFLPRSKHLLISWLQSPSAVILEPPKIVSHCLHCFPIYLPWSDGTGCHYLIFLKVELYANFLTLLFHFHQEALQFFFTFCHKGGVICISEVIDISAGNLDSSLCFLQPSISHDVLCILVKKEGWQYTVLVYSFSYLEPVCCSMSSSNCCFLTCIQVSQEAGQVVWYSHLFQNFPQFVVIHTVKALGAKAEDMGKACPGKAPQGPARL